MKKKLSFFLALALCLGLSIPASAAGRFSDVTGWAEPYIERAAGLGLVTGTGGDRFSPDSPVTYAQFATMLCGLRWQDEVAAKRPSYVNSAWYEIYCDIAYTHELFLDTPVNELDLYSYAGDSLPRADMAAMVYRYLLDCGLSELSDSTLSAAGAGVGDIGHLDAAHTKAVLFCLATGALTGTGTGKFSPDSTMNRAQAATVLCNIYDQLNGTASSTP